MPRRFESILETVGGTPIVRIKKLAPAHVRLYGKVEAFNPMGSVKDRLALGVIEDAERTGQLRPGQTVIEATSGNTGIGLAMVCAEKGYPLVVTMAENFSVERRRLMRFLGARVVLTPAAFKGSGMLAKAVELAEAHGWFLCRQFENEANANMHSRTTAPEILAAFAGERLDYFVTGFGTGGTLKGVARELRKHSPATQIIVCEPDNSQILGSGIPQPRTAQGALAGSHPNFRPHLMQGISPDFIPKLAEDAATLGLIDRVLPVNGAEAMRLARELARQEGIFVGISAGAALAGALAVCAEAPAGATVLCMLPDTGERYLSTQLFADIPADMSAEELTIARSTPNYRFDMSAPPPPAAASGPPPVIAADAAAFVAQVIGDATQPVTLFALEWCEFCWSVRRFFAKQGIAYRSVDLDSVEYQRDNRGGQIRAALTAKTSVATIPQIFVGGEFVGGCTDVFDAYKSGRLQQLLDGARVSYDRSLRLDPYSFLPTWLHPR
ncbi:MAG TPA: pyridoxal-phosphate dependent enzyme [Steroidobacteraceae bacterium]|nr:pyridoxal-phosphate dependent enzyme [Steroidobacteraceae bacterium]